MLRTSRADQLLLGHSFDAHRTVRGLINAAWMGTLAWCVLLGVWFIARQ